MKYSRIMLMTLLLLAVLMIGAVSASDENATDALTIDDEISVDGAVEESPLTSDIGDELGDSSNEILSEKSAPTLGASAEDVVYGNNATVIVNINSDATGSINLTIDQSISFSSEIVGGQSTFNIIRPSVGTHEVLVNYSGDENYLPAMFQFLFSVIAGNNFTALQELIDGASDSLTLASDYTSDGSEINIDKAITIDGQGHTIDANGSSRIFNISTAGVVLKNLNLINANFSGDGGGIYSNNSISLINCSFFNCSSNYGGAIYVEGDNASIMNCSFDDCSAFLDGGAIVLKGNYARVYDSTFANNVAGDDGGAIFWQGNEGVIDRCSFVDNVGNSAGDPSQPAVSKGGTLCIVGSNICILNSNFTGGLTANRNDENVGGAVFIAGNNCTLDGCKLDSCSAEDANGGAIYILGNNSNISNSFFIYSSARSGGAIYIEGSGAFIEGTNFTGNTAKSGWDFNSSNLGGSVYIEGMNAVISHSNFDDSEAYNGGMIYIEGNNAQISASSFNNGYAANDGGAIYATCSNCTVSNSNFTNNLAELSGGSIYWFGGSTTKYNTVDGCIFTNNTAHANTSETITRGGGAIYWSEGGQYGTIKNSEFYNNSVQSTIDKKVDGGAVLWDKNYHALVDNCIFVGNFITTDGDTSGTSASDVWAQGGAMYLRPNANYTVRNCHFENCSSSKEAGALYIQGLASSSVRLILLENCVFINNVAQAKGLYNTNGGGAVQVKQCANIEFINLTFTNNTANKGGALVISDNVNNHQVINCTFDGNNASDGSGGSIWASRAFTMINVTISNSNASGNGGAVYASTGNFDNITISDAHAGGDGGGFYITGNSVTLNNLNVFKSSAQNGGGLYSQKNTVTVSNSLFADNDAINGSAIYNAMYEDCIFERNSLPDIYPYKDKANPDFFTFAFNQTSYEYGQSVGIEASLPSNATGVVYFVISNESNVILYNIRVKLSDGNASCTFPDLPAGKYNLTLQYCGDPNYFDAELNISFEVLKKRVHPEIEVDFNQSIYQYGQSPEITISLPSNATGMVNVSISTKNGGVLYNFTRTLSEGNASFMMSVLPIELYNLTINYLGDSDYYECELNTSFSILPIINMTDKLIAGSSGRITMDFGNDAQGFVDIFVDGERYVSQRIIVGVLNYELSTAELAVGNHTVTFGYEGASFDENLFNYFDLASSKYKPMEFTIEILPENVTTEAKTNDEAEYYEVRIYGEDGNLANDAEGTIQFFINGVQVAVVKVVNGIARLDISKYKNGKYVIDWIYSGDTKYNKSSGHAVMNINRVPIRIVASDLSIIYTSTKMYSVKVYGASGKIAKGAQVVFLINNKAYKTVRTNANGVANIAISKTPGSYKITIKALGAAMTKKLTVNHALSLKTVKVKKSAKKLVIKATLKKIDGKYLKGKKITLKFNGKKFKAKTNKKGVAKFTVKSKVLKKLKVGKKVKYQATYKKDTVKKSVKVKK